MIYGYGASLTLAPIVPSRTQQALQHEGIQLNPYQLKLVERETQRLFNEHVCACRKNGLTPETWERFAVEVAEQVKLGILERSEPLTEHNDDGCRRLLAQLQIAQQTHRLTVWHKKYIAHCWQNGLTAYALSLILDTIAAQATPPSLSTDSLNTQAERINALVVQYVTTAGRKENPRWYAKPPRHCKPSKQFGKYAD